jgi:phosphatidylserine decarboxylase
MLPLTRHGLREILIGTLVLAILSLGLGYLYHPLALLPLPIFIWLLAFFRDPNRPIPGTPGAFVSPADGTVSDITTFATDPLLGCPSIRVGIFLSVFNVHINRSPCDGKVASVQYKRGKFLNALHHQQASEENESNTLVLTDASGETVAVVKQIVGLIARRIICTARPGDTLVRGQRIGMIKFGSRTELTIPQSLHPTIQVRIGQKVRGGADVIATVFPIGGAQHRGLTTSSESRP